MNGERVAFWEHDVLLVLACLWLGDSVFTLFIAASYGMNVFGVLVALIGLGAFALAVWRFSKWYGLL